MFALFPCTHGRSDCVRAKRRTKRNPRTVRFVEYRAEPPCKTAAYQTESRTGISYRNASKLFGRTRCLLPPITTVTIAIISSLYPHSFDCACSSDSSLRIVCHTARESRRTESDKSQTTNCERRRTYTKAKEEHKKRGAKQSKSLMIEVKQFV